MAKTPAEVPRPGETQMTNEQNARIASALCGYEVQVSPAGKWYVVTGDETKPLVDYETDWEEAMTTLIAVCKSRGFGLMINVHPGFKSIVSISMPDEKMIAAGNDKLLSAIAHCLLQIAEGEE